MPTDPVCGMKVDEKRAAGKSVYKGVIDLFCSPFCIQKFEADPTASIQKKVDAAPPSADHKKSSGMASVRALFWKILIRLRWFLRFSRKGGAEIGGRVPDFRLKDLSGRSYTLFENFPNKGAVLWLTNLCSSCEERIPLLERIYQASRDRLEIFAISTLGEDRATPERILRTHRMTFPLLLDPGDWVGKVLGLPHPVGACPLYNLLVLDTAGVIRFKSHLSAIGDEALLDALRSVDAIAAESGFKEEGRQYKRSGT